MQVNWFRNPAQKDKNEIHGTGEIVLLNNLERTGEGIATIVDSATGNFVEKPFSLIQIADFEEPVDTTELTSQITALTNNLNNANSTIERLDLEHGERKVLLEEVGKNLTEANEYISTFQTMVESHDTEVTELKAEITKLKKPKPVAPATTKVVPKK